MPEPPDRRFRTVEGSGFNAPVYRFLRTPRWAAAGVVVILVTGLFVNLGLWQLRRHQERRTTNLVTASRIEAPRAPLSDLITGAGTDLDSLEWRRTTVTGVYLPDLEVLVRSAVRDGKAGFSVITPVEMESGDIVLVDRGWVPLEFDDPPVPAVPPEGSVEIQGWVRLGQQRPAVGAEDPPPPNRVVSRVDPSWFAPLIGREPLDVWVQRSSDDGRLPIPIAMPITNESGPHLAYAIQWFSFALISVVGFALLVRSTARRRSHS